MESGCHSPRVAARAASWQPSVAASPAAVLKGPRAANHCNCRGLHAARPSAPSRMQCASWLRRRPVSAQQRTTP
eukprot:167437-Lingulodinium_polyedra.AAC.1